MQNFLVNYTACTVWLSINGAWKNTSGSFLHTVLSFSSRVTNCGIFLNFLFITLLKCQFKPKAVELLLVPNDYFFFAARVVFGFLLFVCFVFCFCFLFFLPVIAVKSLFDYEIHLIFHILHINIASLFEKKTVSRTWLLSSCHESCQL